MEAVEAVGIGLTQDPLHFQIETEILRRLIRGVHLEILRDRIDALPQHLKQRCIRGLGRQHRTRQQHDAMGHVTSTMRNRAWLLIMRSYASTACSSGIVSIIGRTAVSALKARVSCESIEVPDA